MSKQRKISKSILANKKTIIIILLIALIVAGYFRTTGAFWFIFTAIYLLPNFYLYNKIKKIFSRKRRRLIFTILFALLVAALPVGEVLEHNTDSKIGNVTLWIAYYYLPVLLYTFFLYLLIDLGKASNQLLKLLPSYVFSTRKFRIYSLSVILLITAVINIAGIYNFNNTSVTSYNIEVPQKLSKLDNMKIAVAADFHFSDHTQRSFVRQFVEKLNSIEPDIVLFPGDLIESLPGKKKSAFIQDELGKIKARYGIYASEGNHELYGNKKKLSFFDNTGIKFLRDTVKEKADSFVIIGRRDRQNQERESLQTLLENTTDSLPRIVLDHQPFELKKVSENNINLQVSGHTHHGQLFPFQLITKAIYRISWGYKKINNTHFFVTCGAQGWGPPVKTSSYSEIMEININFTE
ncbi:MAG: metallophosphoesterase [Bacteroidales bacterium]